VGRFGFRPASPGRLDPASRPAAGRAWRLAGVPAV